MGVAVGLLGAFVGTSGDPPRRLPCGALEQPIELQLVLRPDKDRVREPAEQAVTGVSYLTPRVAPEPHPLSWDRRVRERRGALGYPASQLDVGLKTSGIEAGIEVAVLDCPPGVE